MVGIGLMSGTSVDAVDAALVEFLPSHDPPVQLIAYHEETIQSNFRERIQTAMCPQRSSVELICQLNFEIGNLFAQAARIVVEKAGMDIDQVDFIGSHGQTVQHIPQCDTERGWLTPSTLQLGDPCVIAELTGILTVADFRIRDMAAGGIGAPLIPFVDAFLFAQPDRDILCQNIGGIANCALIRHDGEIVAFDSGPGNMVMDLLTQNCCNGLRFDRDGRLAEKGTVISALLNKAQAHPFFQEKPPKATGHELFGMNYVEWFINQAGGALVEDLIATACELTARSIVQAYRDFIFPEGNPDTVIVSGGGAKNGTLMRRLTELCP